MLEEEFMEGENLSKKIFTADEIETCSMDGDCVQCGLCCYAFSTVVPDTIPAIDTDKNVEAYVKSGFEFCKHLVETDKGLFLCSCHKFKGHSLMQDCVGWEGNNRRGSISDYESIEQIFQEKFVSFTQPQLLVLNRLIERGVIHFTLISKDFTDDNRKELLIKLLTNCESVPHALLEKIETKKYFKDFSRLNIKKFLRENDFTFKELSTKQKILLKVYLPQLYLK